MRALLRADRHGGAHRAHDHRPGRVPREPWPRSPEHGYAIDDGEQELGVRCVAVAVPDAPSRIAMSVSGPAARMTEQLVERAVPLLTGAAAALAKDLASGHPAEPRYRRDAGVPRRGDWLRDPSTTPRSTR